MASLETLVGHAVSGVFATAEGRFLRFDCEDGPHYFEAVGDCCSQSWVAEVLGSVAGQGNVESVEEIDLPALDPESEHKIYSFYIKARSYGGCTVIFRNDSNGYYGGYLEGRTQAEMDRLQRDGEVGEFLSVDDEWLATGSGG